MPNLGSGLEQKILGIWRDIFTHCRWLALFCHDRTGTLIDANPAFCGLVGYPREELIGQSLRRLLSSQTIDDYLRWVDLCRQSQTEAPGSLELGLRNKDGSEAWVESDLVAATENGDSHLVLIAVRDITARKASEQRLRQHEETARVLLNATRNAAFIIDLQGRILSANQEAALMVGTPLDDLHNKQLADCLPPDAAEGRRQKNLEAIRSGKPVFFEDEAGGKAFSNAVHPVRDEKGQVATLVVYSKDITEEKQSEEERKKLTAQLQQAQKMEAIGTLAGGIAHDFNNLLMAIQGNVSLILFDMEASHPHHRILANIENLIRSGADLTSKLLGYARRGKYESRPMGMNDLVRETSETFGRMRKDITIHQDLAEDLMSIIADRGQLEQVLLNLFVNAADAMPGGGRLTLKTRNVSHREIPSGSYAIKPGPYVVLTVTDTGIGMAAETIARIFDPFFTTKKMGRGTGLGLASAYGIVKGHNGYIEVDSEQGKGTTFSVFLPATEQRRPDDASPHWKPAAGSGMILLVDDEPAVLEVTAQMIERLGYTVTLARSGREAIERFREKPGGFSLVILDMIMPEMGGGEVFDQLKRIQPQVKVLLASGYSMQGQAREIMNRGCIGFIQKPFNLQDLSIRLHSILNSI
jgi:two-component system, cell cycle sensor histidine kinase and response regulator CckA